MDHPDFYFLFSDQIQEPRLTETLFRGSNRNGHWSLEMHGARVTSMPGLQKYETGLASDREKPQYQIIITPENIEITSEIFGISPVFYAVINEEIHISSSIRILAGTLKSKDKLHISKNFILEQNLFNYSLFNNTVFNEIKLVPSNCKAIITDRLQIEKIFKIEDYFTDSPVPYKKCIQNLTDLFISQNASKIQDDDYISFTSGFDGRSLLALALSQNKKIHAYSFGASDNIDLYLPRRQAAILRVDFLPVVLDENRYIDSFLAEGSEALIQSAANTNFLQLHWSYAARILSGKTGTIVTGMFGSELFRAPHIAGQMISPALVDYVRFIKDDKWIGRLKNEDSLHFLNINSFTYEFESLINDLQEFKKRIISLSESQRLYKYIYEETFRKFFGMQFIQPMRSYVNVVNPYLDWEFMKELLKTQLAGVNSDFFTENPWKRYKGQLFYAELIRRTSSELYSLQTGKGYTPEDLQKKMGKFKIAVSFARKRLHRRIASPDLDDLKIISGVNHFLHGITEKGMFNEYYNQLFVASTLKSGKWQKNEMLRDKFVETLSTNYYLKNLF
jgi:hypothetical protein